RPADMQNFNNEGFALAPDTECASDAKPVYWADDKNDDHHALRSGAIACTMLAPTPTPTATATPRPTPTPGPLADRTAPGLKVAVKHAVLRTRKLGVAIALGEKADLTITATARRTTRARARTLFKSTRKGIAAGKRTLTFTLTRAARASLRKGARVTVTVVAR